jgi:hypothetical protein
MTEHGDEPTPGTTGRAHRLAWLCALAGIVLALIGLRFLLAPEAAMRFFGIGSAPATHTLAGLVGLRDLWLGLLAIGLAALREWRALALWLGLGGLVCLGDAAIVAGTTAKAAAIAFHVGSGLVCAALAGAVYRLSSRLDGK